MMSSTQPETGAVIDGKYRIVRLIGRGGMGAVYLAEHLALRRPVALKLMGEALRANEQYVRRFEREAKATFGLEHRNIVRVYDYGHEPAPYLVMEWIDGETLKEHLNGLAQPPPLEWVRQVMEQLFQALQAAHTNGVVHRDLKPENILLRQDPVTPGSPLMKVVDFGMARVADVFEGEPTLTQLDFVAGTPAYMSPEQCRSLVVGPASDLYAAGCILTELLQLSPPFRNGSAAELMSQQMFAPPPQLLRPPNAQVVPAPLERLRRALLAKHLHLRPASATEALAELNSCFSENEPAPNRGSMSDQLRRHDRSEPPDAAEHRARVFFYVSPELGSPVGDAELLAWGANGTDVSSWSSSSDGAGEVVLIACPNVEAPTLALVLAAIKNVTSVGALAIVAGERIPASVLPSWIEAGVIHVVERADPTSIESVWRSKRYHRPKQSH